MVEHFPDPVDGWERRDPADAGMDAAALQTAIEYAKTHETPHEQVAYDFSTHDPWDTDPAEWAGAIGPMPDRRGGPAGMVIRDGYLVAEWGDTTRVDHAFSIAKSFLATLAGVAYDRLLIEDVDDRVVEYVDEGYQSEHNTEITWEHLLQQTSEWEGTLFGKPDLIDRNRPVGKRDDELEGPGGQRDLREPGTYWEYNDVRINQLALSLLYLYRKPLPRVLDHEIMQPIGTSGAWEWHGYYNSDVSVGDRTMKSVSGGGHWGGGIWLPTRDLARLGLLYLNRGQWEDKRLLSEEWIDMVTTPCAVKPSYGYLWWLNTDNALWPSAPETSYAAIGHGWNTLWVDPEHDLVVTLRWIRSAEDSAERDDFPVIDGFYDRLLDAVE